MNRYRLLAYGRRVGAQGITSAIVFDTRAVDDDGARRALYEKYEHISQLKILRYDGNVSQWIEVQQ